MNANAFGRATHVIENGGKKKSVDESATKYEALLKAVPDMMFVLTRDGTYVDFKAERAEELLIPPDQIIGKNIADTGFTPPLIKEILSRIARALDSGEMQTMEYDIEPAGEPARYEARIVPLNESEVLSIVRNISERARIERAMKDQRDFLRQVIDINPNFVFAKDRQGRFTLVNRAIADAYGTSVDDLIGKTDADFTPSQQEVEGFRRDDLEVMTKRREKFVPEETITDAAGEKRWLQTVKRPIIDKNGEASQVLGVAVDITRYKLAVAELEKTSEQLREEREALAEKNAALREILDHIERERMNYRQKSRPRVRAVALASFKAVAEKGSGCPAARSRGAGVDRAADHSQRQGSHSGTL